MVKNFYFKYKKRNRSGYIGISEKNDIKLLKKLNIKGFSFISEFSDFLYFKIETQLYRKLKLFNLGSGDIDRKTKHLNFMINLSKKINPEGVDNLHELPDSICYYCNYDYKEYQEKQYRNKQRSRCHDRYYKQKMKR